MGLEARCLYGNLKCLVININYRYLGIINKMFIYNKYYYSINSIYL